MALSPSERSRYLRQLSLSEIGEAGQRALGEATVTLVGVGGLGSAAASYLAAAGIGRLRLVDGDQVELSNLTRQVLYGEPDLGTPKIERALRRLAALNPGVELVGVSEMLDAGNAPALVADADVVVDCLDSFAARFLLNEAVVAAGGALVHGACSGLEGRLATFRPPETACLRCLLPSAPPAAPAPVLGATPGVIGAMQALETIKLIVGAGDTLAGKLLIFDGARWSFDLVEVARDPSCPVCGGSR